MKLVRFVTAEHGAARFGVVIGDWVGAFADIAEALEAPASELDSMERYLDALPQSRELAQSLYEQVAARPQSFSGCLHEFSQLRLLPPLLPAALYDFALTPRHLQAAARTLMRYEMPQPLRGLAGWIAARRYQGPLRAEALRFYVGSPHALSGPGDEIPWPAHTAYLDIEPELAVVTGAMQRGLSAAETQERIAGYTILNDWSARDVQFPEMRTGTMGFMRAKHFEGGNGLGPWLVTPDELPEPYRQTVEVRIGERLRWRGSTQEYALRAENVLGLLLDLSPLPAGTLVGLGTVPGCCGLDNDEWLRPGETVSLTFDGIGELVQTAGLPRVPVLSRRWPLRRDLGLR